jgi:FtsH-binding integral membrane protein
MTESMHSYFREEKSEALFFLIAGILSLGLSVWAFFFNRERFFVGLAIPVLVVGLIQLVVGAVVFFRTQQQVAGLEDLFATDPAKFATSELERMITVMNNFRLYKWVEIGFVVSGLLLIIFNVPGFLQGIAVGLLLQGSIMLSLDIVAERRGVSYQQELHQLQPAS